MRKWSGMLVMLLLALLLAACGSNGEDEDTGDVTPTSTTATGTEPDTTIATMAATGRAELTGDDLSATPPATMPGQAATPGAVASPEGLASPAAATPRVAATPVAAVPPVSVASPAVTGSPVISASPIVVTGAASPAATPESGIAVKTAETGAGTPAAAANRQTLAGTVVLPGAANEAFVMTDDGCVGIGEHAGIQTGQQVVVRDAEGSIIGVTMLNAANASDTCAWTFTVDVPSSAFYAVSIPMTTEHVFTREQVERGNGDITLTLE